MLNLDADERVTLELIASRGEHVVFDGSTLSELHDKGLVEISIDGWNVTPLGRFVARSLAAER